LQRRIYKGISSAAGWSILLKSAYFSALLIVLISTSQNSRLFNLYFSEVSQAPKREEASVNIDVTGVQDLLPRNVPGTRKGKKTL
jgi:hypothetical protein